MPEYCLVLRKTMVGKRRAIELLQVYEYGAWSDVQCFPTPDNERLGIDADLLIDEWHCKLAQSSRRSLEIANVT